MKKTLLASAIAALSIGTTPIVLADDAVTNSNDNTTSGWKAAGVFTTSTLLGAAAGGPVGMFLGAIGGAYLGEQVEKADKVDDQEALLAEQTMQLAELQTQLAYADNKVGELSQIALDKLEFQVLFHTGADKLTERGEARVVALANFLQQHPGLSVRLTGHTDPRGTDEYNNVLSEHRALAVQQSLVDAGIDDYRIERRSYGSLQSLAPKGNYEAYAMERRVDIEIFNPMIADTFVQAH